MCGGGEAVGWLLDDLSHLHLGTNKLESDRLQMGYKTIEGMRENEGNKR